MYKFNSKNTIMGNVVLNMFNVNIFRLIDVLDVICCLILYKKHRELIKPFQSSAAFYIEISHLIFKANQTTGFYMKRNIGLKWVNYQPVFHSDRNQSIDM